MPRHDWRDDDQMMSRERGDYDHRERSRDRGRDRDQGAFFGDDRGRGRQGGWGSLFGDESSGSRMRDDRHRERNREDRQRERGFGPDDKRNDIPRDETERLIASNKVEGTPVYDRNGDRLGSVHNFMVDKFSGRVVYAVLKHGSGFLGLDDRYYPIEWDQLTFDTRLGGYRVRFSEEGLKESGSWDRNERWSEGGSGHGRSDRDREQRSQRRDRW